MTKTEEAKFIKKLIKDIRRDYIVRCAKYEDMELECIECRACICVEFLQNHIKLLDDLER